MAINVCKKGKRVELEVAHWFGTHGLHARRTQQHNGAEGLSDVVCEELPFWHIEVKGTSKKRLPRGTVTGWYTQITRDCPESLVPVLLNKPNKGELIVMLPFTVFKALTPSIGCYSPDACVADSIMPENILMEQEVRIKIGALAEGGDAQAVPVVYYLTTNDDLVVFMFANHWIKACKLSEAK